jgi:hypothetical protein
MCGRNFFFVYKYGGHLIYVLLFLFVIHLIIIYTASEKKKREIEIDEYMTNLHPKLKLNKER